MSNRQQRSTYRTDGSLALRATSPRDSFRVLEGGKAHSDARPLSNDHRTGQMGVLFAVVAIVVTLAGGALLSNHLHERHVAALLNEATYKTVVVRSGATLWQIAEDNPLEGCSTTEQVATIRAINQLPSADLQVGMKLQVPVRA